MAHCALWVRTTRHIDTCDAEIAALEWALVRLVPEGVSQPLRGDDAAVYTLVWEDGPDRLLRMLQPDLEAGPFEDWQAVEIGVCIASAPLPVHDEDDGALDGEEDDATLLASTLPAVLPPPLRIPFGAVPLVWTPRDRVNTYGCLGLFIDLEHERTDRDPLLREIEARMPKPFARLWHGRTSILYAFHSQRDVETVGSGVSLDLGRPEISDYALFTIGSRSASRANLNPMADWIETNYRLSKGIKALERPSRASRDVFDRGAARRVPMAFAFPELRTRRKDDR